MIKMTNASLQYQDGTTALHNISLELKPGELVFVTGPSGSGKTSLLKLLMGMEYSTKGQVEVLGQGMKRGQSRRIQKLRKSIGPVFQEFKLIQGHNAIENVIMGMRFLGIAPRQRKIEALNMLQQVGLEHKAYTPVEHLSWGECQRVAIARAVARKPKLILADEPTGNLDQENAIHILELLASFRNDTTTVIITTHATHLVEPLDHVTFLHVNHGEISVERRGDVIL